MHFAIGEAVLVVGPRHGFLAGGDFDHADALVHGADDAAEVAADAVFFADFRDGFVRHAAGAVAEAVGFGVEQVDVHGVPTLLLHGDTLCTADTAYLQFRAQVRQPSWQTAFLSQPLPARRAFAANARAQSKLHTQSAAMTIMDVAEDAVADAFRSHRVQRMIHGHTHRPAIHAPLRVDGLDCQRIVLGDWHRNGSILRVDGAGLTLDTLPFQ